MSNFVILGLILWPFVFKAAAAAVATGAAAVYPFSDCFDQYIPENSSVTCHCKANNSASSTTSSSTTLSSSSSSSSASFFWLNHSGMGSSWELRLREVKRTMNGSRYVCSMLDGALIRNVTYELRVAYGPSSADTRILAPSPFITNGSRDLNLSCEVTNTYPDPWISWTFVTCRDGLTDPCVIRPKVSDDGLRVVCTATSTVHQGLLTSTAEFFLQLNYPPEQPPQIRTQTNNKILKTGDTITCTVTGGKPRVRRVIFNCSNPTLQGVSFVTDRDTTSSMSSSIIVDSTEATADHMLCSCGAEWEPDPSLYGYSSTAAFLLEYKATITNFTVNTSSELVVMEEDQSAVEFHCDVMGRASAEVTLHKQRTNATLGKTVEVVGEESDRRKVHRYILHPARCEDMGVFTCQADSGYMQPSTKSVRLTVNCGPRPYSALGTDNILKLRGRETAELRLVAYPVPEHIHFSLLPSPDQRYNHSHSHSHSGQDGLDDLFQTQCVGEELVKHLVKCRIGRGDLAPDHEALYNVTVSNAFGAFQFVLDVRAVENDPALSAATAVLISAMVAATVVIVLIVFVVFLLRKKRGRDVECTRVSNRRSLAAFMMEANNDNDDPSNSRLPFVEVRPISSDIQFRSTDPSDAPVSFSHILPSLSSDGGPNKSESVHAQNEGLPVLTSLVQRASDFTASSPLPRAQVSPFFSGGPYEKELEVEEKVGDDDDNDDDDDDDVEEDLFEKKMADSEVESREYPPSPPAQSRTSPGGCDGDSLTPAPEAGNIVWMDSAPESLESTPRLLSGTEEGHHSASLKPPGPDASPLQSLVSAGSRSRTFITKIYLPKQSSDAESHGREESGELLSVGPLGDEYAVVNKAGREGRPPTRPLLKEVFAGHKEQAPVEALPGGPQAKASDYDEVPTKKTTPDLVPVAYHNAAYEDVVIPAKDDSRTSVEKKGPERPQRREKPQRASGKMERKSEGKMNEAEESAAPSVTKAARSSSAKNTPPSHGYQDKDTPAEQDRTEEDTDLEKLLMAQPREAVRPSREEGEAMQNSEQTLQTRQLHRFLKKHQDELPGEQKTDLGRRQDSSNKQGSASLTRHRRKKADSEDALSLPESQEESSYTLRSVTTQSTEEAPKPKKRTRKLTKRRRKSDPEGEKDEAHILGP